MVPGTEASEGLSLARNPRTQLFNGKLVERVFLCILYNYKSNKNIITKKIEDQIWPNLDRLARVFNIQSSGSVNLEFLSRFYTGDDSYNPIIKKLFKFFGRDVATTAFLKHLGWHFFVW